MPLLSLALGLCLAAQQTFVSPVQGAVDGVSAPVLIKRVDPKYPRSFFHRSPTGTVLVALRIGPDGVPTDVRIATSSGNDKLDQSAVTAVEQYRFKPAMKDGHPVPVAMKIQVAFHTY